MMLKIKQTAGHLTVLKLAALSQALLLLFVGMTANAQEGNRLQDIQVQTLPGQRVELKLIMTDTAPEPLAFTIDNPARIALDLPDTALGLTSRRRDVNLGPLATVLTAEANGRTRVVLNLEHGRGRKRIHISVRDYGPGVPVGELERIFEPFYRVQESRDRGSGGHGLGLSIAANAVRRHGGSIVAGNAGGGGLIVMISLPLNRDGA